MPKVKPGSRKQREIFIKQAIKKGKFNTARTQACKLGPDCEWYIPKKRSLQRTKKNRYEGHLKRPKRH